MAKIISGIQQIGIGIPDVHQAWHWYRQHFGVDIPIFEEAAVAKLMVPYTGGKPQARHALLAINLQGGGGFEIWQFKDRVPVKPAFDLRLGDYGLFTARIKCRDVPAAYQAFETKGLDVVSPPGSDPAGGKHFFVRDPYGNIFQVVAGHCWFKNEGGLIGGLAGAMIGVSDVGRSRLLYSDILGYDELVYDQTAIFPDLCGLAGGGQLVRRVLLRHSQPRQGGFSRLLGPSEIELIQAVDGTARRIYENRYWGDLGFIHLCYDIIGMEELEKECRAAGFPFTINSSRTFDMGEAAGHFAYIEDPDGTLIEFVETHKIPILKKIGWYLNLRNRKPESPLPDWLLKALRFNRVMH
jgi:catechol 2,3-dioxygenase-like lactoylglutathione lyase family enzyme